MGRVQGKLAVARSFGDLDFKNEQTLEARWITAEPDILLIIVNILILSPS